MANHESGIRGSEVMYPAVPGGNSHAHSMVPAESYTPLPPEFGGFPRGPEILSGPFNQVWLVNCLRRRWLPAVLLGLLSAGIAALILWWAFPLSSNVVALLKVEPSGGADLLERQSSQVNWKDFERFQQTQLALFKSDFVLRSALQRRDIAQLDAVLNNAPDELTWLYDELRVSFPGDGEILEIKYVGFEDAEDMKKIIDALVQAYEQEVTFAELARRAETNRSFKQLLNELSEELREKVDKYQVLRRQLGGSDSPTANAELTMLIGNVKTIQQQIINLRQEEINIEVNREIARLQSTSASMVTQAIAEAMEKDPILTNFENEKYAIQQYIRSLQTISKRTNSPEINRLNAQLRQLDQESQQYRMAKEAELRNRIKAAPNDYYQQVMAEYLMRRQNIHSQLTELNEEYEDTLEQIKQKGETSGEVAMLDAEIEQLRAVQQALDFRLRGRELEAEAARKQITVMQQASARENINAFEQGAICSLGALAALAATCYIVALIEFRRRRLNSAIDVDEGLGIRVLGVLPPVGSRKAMAPGSAVGAQLAESIDNVRATIMHDSTSRPRQAILVASPSSMEGSTTVASHLALSLTRAGRRTLLVDGDLREPTLHKLFGMPLEDGLSEVLRSELEVADSIRPTNTEGLWLMTAGVCDMDAIHALATDQLQPVFEKLRAEFDFIIIDGAPILGLSDSISIGQHVDGAILTVLRDHSEVRNIYQASETLRSLGIRLIGSVVNGVPFKADRRVTRLHRAAPPRVKQIKDVSGTSEN